MDDEFFNDGIHLGFHSSNSKRSTEVAHEGMDPGCNIEEEVSFIDAGVNSGVEVKMEELRAGRNGEAVCELGFEDTSSHVGDLLHRRPLPVSCGFE